VAKTKIEDLLKPSQVALIMERSGATSIDFQIKISTTPSDSEAVEESVQALVYYCAGLMAEVKEKGVDLVTKGVKVMKAAKEINLQDEHGKP